DDKFMQDAMSGFHPYESRCRVLQSGRFSVGGALIPNFIAVALSVIYAFRGKPTRMCDQRNRASKGLEMTTAEREGLPSTRYTNRSLRDAPLSFVALTMIALVAANPSRAIDSQPGDWVAYPVSNVVMGYAEFATSSELDNTIVGEVPHSHLDTGVGIARF